MTQPGNGINNAWNPENMSGCGTVENRLDGEMVDDIRGQLVVQAGQSPKCPQFVEGIDTLPGEWEGTQRKPLC